MVFSNFFNILKDCLLKMPKIVAAWRCSVFSVPSATVVKEFSRRGPDFQKRSVFDYNDIWGQVTEGKERGQLIGGTRTAFLRSNSSRRNSKEGNSPNTKKYTRKSNLYAVKRAPVDEIYFIKSNVGGQNIYFKTYLKWTYISF